MNTHLPRRKLMKRVETILQSADFNGAMEELRGLQVMGAINALIGRLSHADEQLRQRSIAACGVLISELADRNMETARVVLRRLLWNLTEESGNCAWGAPELIGETLANHEQLAVEFSPVLISFIMPEGNCLEYEPLLRGAVWGVTRLALVKPDLAVEAEPYLASLMSADDEGIARLACAALALIGSEEVRNIERFAGDSPVFAYYRNGELIRLSMNELVNRNRTEIE